MLDDCTELLHTDPALHVVPGEDTTDICVDDALRLEARGQDLIHKVNTMRRDAGLDITDRIFLTLLQADRDLLKHRDWIAVETLARSITVGGTLSVVKTT